MIYYIEGILKEKSPSHIIVDVNGIGYKINIPFSLFDKLPEPEEKVKIYTYLHTKDNAIELYGFLHQEDREFFLDLISLSSIGPRSALRMLSRITPSQFKKAIVKKDLTRLVKTPGVGKKTAQRLIFELGEITKEKTPSPKEDKVYQDGVNALISLGYNRRQAEEAINKSLTKNSSLRENLTSLIKEALKYV